MAVNFGGAGFSFVGKDEGLTKTLNSVEKGFSGVYDKFKMVAEGATKMGGMVGTSLRQMGGAGKRAIGGLAGVLDSMASKALNPKIDNAFSSMHAQFGKTWGAVTVGMKTTSKEAGKWKRAIGGAAFALNVDMGETAKSWSAFEKQGLDLRKVMGKKGMYGAVKSLIEVTETLGVSGEQLALMISGLGRGFGFSTKRAMALMDTVFAMGKAFNVGKEMMQEMPGILQDVNKQLADFGIEAKPKDVEQMTMSIVKLGIGLKESLGMSAKDATSSAKALFNTLIGERRNIVDMFRGMGGEFSEFSKALAEKGGVKNALMMVLKDPAKFMDKLREMAKKTEKQGGKMGLGLQRLVGVMNKAVGPDVTFAMKGNWDNAAAAMKKLDGISKDTLKNLGAMTKAAKKSYRSGRTAGDAFTIMLQSQEAAIQKLSNPLLKDWIKDQRKGFKDFRGGLKKIVDKGGPLGKLTERLLLVQRVGLSGLFSGKTGLGAMAPMIMQTVQKMGPMLSAFAALGVSLAMIGKLLLPGGIILMGLMLFHKGARDKIMATLEKVWGYLKENVPKWIPIVKKALVELWAKSVEAVKWAMDVVAPMMSKLADAIGNADWGGMAQRAVSFIGKFFRGVFNFIFDIGSQDFDLNTPEGRFMKAGAKLIGALGKGIKSALVVVLKNVWTFFTDWSMGWEEGLRSKGTLLGGIFITALFFGSTRKLALQGAWMMVKLVAQYLIYPILAMMGQFFMGMIARQGTYLAVSMGLEKASYAKKLGMAITYHLKSIMWLGISLAKQGAMWVASAAWLLVQKAYFYTRHLVLSAVFWAKDRLIDVAGWALKGLKWVGGMALLAATTVAGWVAVGASNALGWVVSKAADIAGWALRGAIWIGGWFAARAVTVAGWAFMVASTVAGWIASNAAAMAGALGMAASWAVAFWPVTLVIAAIAGIGLAFYALTGKLGKTAQDIGRIITWPFMFLWETVQPLVSAIKALFSGDFAGFFKNISDFIGKVITAPFRFLWGVVNNAVTLISGLWNKLRDMLGETGKAIMDVISAPFRAAWWVVEGVINKIKGAWESVTGFIGKVGGGIVSGIKSLFGGTKTEVISVSDTIGASISKAAEAAAQAMEKSNTSIQAKSNQTTAVVTQASQVQTANTQANAMTMREGVGEQYMFMQRNAQQVYGAIDQTGAQTANSLMGQSAQTVNSTQGYWSRVPSFMGKMFQGVLGTSAQTNTQLGQHGAQAANATNNAWGRSGQFVGKTWAMVSKHVVALWEGITSGALKSSNAVIKAALAQAKASGMSIEKQQELVKAMKEVEKMGREHEKFTKKQKEGRESSYFDYMKRLQGSGIKKIATGTFAGYDAKDVMQVITQQKFGKKWTEKQTAGLERLIQTQRELEAMAAKLKGKKGMGDLYQKAMGSITKGREQMKKQFGVEDLGQMSAQQAVERMKGIKVKQMATDIISREQALRQAVSDMRLAGAKHARLVWKGKKAYIEGLDNPVHRKMFQARARDLQRKMAEEGGQGGLQISAPTIGAGGEIKATNVSAGRIKVNKITPGGATTTPGGPTGMKKEEKRVSWTVSNETQTAMKDVAGSLDTLASSIKGLGRNINVQVQIVGEMEPFLRAIRKRGSIGNLATKPGMVS